MDSSVGFIRPLALELQQLAFAVWFSQVSHHLAEGKLAEAAACLEESVRGTQAAEIVAGWVRQARNRAISEQAVLLLQSYANSLSLT